MKKETVCRKKHNPKKAGVAVLILFKVDFKVPESL